MNRAADVGWLALTAVAGLSVAVQLVATAAVVVLGPRGMNLVLLPGGALASWWFARGAWLRTGRHRPPEGSTAPWAEPVLTERRAWWYIWLGAACVVTAALAVALQALHWVD